MWGDLSPTTEKQPATSDASAYYDQSQTYARQYIPSEGRPSPILIVEIREEPPIGPR